MNSGQNKTRWFVWLGVAFLQLIMTQVVTFLFSLFIPDVEQFQQAKSVMFVLILGISFSVGVFLVGWLAFKFGWLKGKPNLMARLIWVLLGAFVPLIIALVIYRVLEAGNPFFAVSTLLSILGFHVPGWFAKE
jgi:hypothetical protein